MASKSKAKKKSKAEANEFNELGCREIQVVEDEFVHHSWCRESKGVGFVVEARVIITLKDGRILNKVFDLDFDMDDVES